MSSLPAELKPAALSLRASFRWWCPPVGSEGIRPAHRRPLSKSAPGVAIPHFWPLHGRSPPPRARASKGSGGASGSNQRSASRASRLRRALAPARRRIRGRKSARAAHQRRVVLVHLLQLRRSKLRNCEQTPAPHHGRDMRRRRPPPIRHPRRGRESTALAKPGAHDAVLGPLPRLDPPPMMVSERCFGAVSARSPNARRAAGGKFCAAHLPTRPVEASAPPGGRGVAQRRKLA